MKRFFLSALSLAVVPFAMGSDGKFELGAFSLRLGGVYPFEDATRRITKNMIGVGLDFNLGPGLIRGAETYGSLEWFGKSAGGAKGNMFPFMLNQRLYLTEDDGRNLRQYVYFGLGFVNIDVFTAKTVWGARAGVGANLSQLMFAEAGFTYSDGANGARANSAGVWIGYRF